MPKEPKDKQRPVIPNDDTANMVAAHARNLAKRARVALDTNAQVFPSLALRVNRGRTVQYVDFGFQSARELWDELVLPACEQFKAVPSRANAIVASWAAWHLKDWLWHEKHPGEETRNNKNYEAFDGVLFSDCPELAWIRDVAEAGKHRGLGRASLVVSKVENTWPDNSTPAVIHLTDGTEHEFGNVLSIVIEYWRREYFP
jgi:hypothetical protein